MSLSPVLSVIIPVYNDPDGLRQTLSSLVNQRHNPVFEAIVVDNNSTDETPQVIEEFEREYPDIVFGCEEIDIQSSYAARNTGIENASGEILAFIDADITVGVTWVADVHERFQESDVDYLGCDVEMYIPVGKKTFWARYDYSMGLPVKHYLQTKRFAPTCSLVVRKTVLDDQGHFDESLVSGGDKEFGHRVDAAGFNMKFAADITVQHPVRNTFESHIKKAKRIGIGQFQLWEKYNLADHPLSPIRFLPPNPSRILERKCGEENFVTIYFVSYFLKIVQASTAAYKVL